MVILTVIIVVVIYTPITTIETVPVAGVGNPVKDMNGHTIIFVVTHTPAVMIVLVASPQKMY